MNAWRLLELEASNAFMNMATDEAILQAKIAGKVPNTLRFFRWLPSAVSIGRFQEVQKEVRVENCKKQGIDIVRRISGGGAVYHDYGGEITYSVTVGTEDLGTGDVFAAYNLICNGLIDAIKILGINADFNLGNPKNCPNVSINGKKISGSAQSHKRGVLLQHGTLLVDVDLKKMFTFLNVPWAKTCMEVVNVAEKKITSVKQELGSSISMTEAYEALVKGFGKALGIVLKKGELTSYEQKLAEKLCKEKYSTDEWNFDGKIASTFG
jgi:lipoate-protein ligase A